MQARKILLTGDGSHSIFSASGILYHSRHGAVEESRHVFIEAALKYRLADKSHLRILEIGFGTGLNAFLTYLETLSHPCQIQYHTYELYPLSLEEICQLNYPTVIEVPQEQRVFEQLHSSDWERAISISPQFSLQKFQESFISINAVGQYDLIYFDPFAPNDQPEFWEEAFLLKMRNALKPGGVLTTYCAKGVVKRTLRKVGFTVENLPGPPGKREMTRAKV